MKIAVCENDMGDALKIAENIHKAYAEDSIRCFANLFALVTYIYDERKGDVDLVILPTDVDREDGIEVARSLQEFYPGIQIIFLSNLTMRIQDIFRAKIVYLLIRPVSSAHLAKAIQNAHEQYEKKKKSTIALKFRGNLFRINIMEIYFVESIGRKLYIYTNDNKWETNMRMEDMRGMLPDNFRLCHRSYLVNINYIIKIGNNDIELQNHMHVQVAKIRSAEIIQELEK